MSWCGGVSENLIFYLQLIHQWLFFLFHLSVLHLWKKFPRFFLDLIHMCSHIQLAWNQPRFSFLPSEWKPISPDFVFSFSMIDYRVDRPRAFFSGSFCLVLTVLFLFPAVLSPPITDTDCWSKLPNKKRRTKVSLMVYYVYLVLFQKSGVLVHIPFYFLKSVLKKEGPTKKKLVLLSVLFRSIHNDWMMNDDERLVRRSETKNTLYRSQFL